MKSGKFNHKKICDQFIKIAMSTSEESRDRDKYLIDTFWGHVDDFYSFIIVAQGELDKSQIRKARAIRLMADIALAGIAITMKEYKK